MRRETREQERLEERREQEKGLRKMIKESEEAAEEERLLKARKQEKLNQEEWKFFDEIRAYELDMQEDLCNSDEDKKTDAEEDLAYAFEEYGKIHVIKFTNKLMSMETRTRESKNDMDQQVLRNRAHSQVKAARWSEIEEEKKQARRQCDYGIKNQLRRGRSKRTKRSVSTLP